MNCSRLNDDMSDLRLDQDMQVLRSALPPADHRVHVLQQRGWQRVQGSAEVTVHVRVQQHVDLTVVSAPITHQVKILSNTQDDTVSQCWNTLSLGHVVTTESAEQ